jgi:uncharacterized protein YkwD
MPADPAPVWPATLLQLLNAERARLDLIPLLPDDRLAAAAARHASWLTGPACPALWGSGALYSGWADRIAAGGYPLGAATGMSIAGARDTPAGAVSAWLASPADCAAIRNPEFEAAGFGMGVASDGVRWWVAAWAGPSKVD